MQKHIVVVILTVFSVITWACYLQHDTSEFIEMLSQEHTPTQQINDISPELIEVFTKIQPIYKDMEQIYNVLAPLDKQIYYYGA